jgi:RimJ/RimL family protein N-acetyltransferase
MIDQPVLITERLLLRPFSLEDAPAVERLAGTKEVADTTLTIPHPYPPGAAESWIGTHRDDWENGTGVNYAIIEKGREELVGTVGLSIDSRHKSAELGYWVGPPFWNRGYCTEAARAVVAMAFDTLHLHRVESRHFVRNPSSGRVMEKLGMTREGVQREAMLKNDRFEDLVLYAVLSTDARMK